MENPKILKAEVLITYECQLKCKGCQVINMADKVKEPEFNIDNWKDAFNRIYYGLNSDFICIYGAEPSMLGKENLGAVVEELSSHLKNGKSYSIISNGLKIDNDYADYLISKGLDSFTCSVDTITDTAYDKSSQVKSQVGLNVIDMFKEKGVRDTCGIITVTKKNIHDVPNTIRMLDSKGHFINIDLIHYDKQHGNDTFSKSKEELSDVVFTDADIPILKETANKIIGMKRQGVKIFPPVEYFEMWKQPKYSVHLNWKCDEGKYPHSITIRPDFKIQNCDCYPGKRIGEYTIFDLPEKWPEFTKDYFEDVAECPGCLWSTHFMAKQITMDYKKEKGEYYQHKK